MQFRVLGPLEVERDGELVDVGPRKQREVLSLLLMHPGEVVTSERLLTAVWGEDRPTTENALWVTVSRLRTALEGAEGALVTRDHGYALDVDPASVDAVRFESLVDEARRRKEHDPGGARERLEEALAMWRGEAWTDVAYRDFALAEVRRLEEMHVSAGEDLLELRLRAGQAAEVVAPLRSITTEHPLRERPVALLMLALHRSGRQAEALGVFADHARRLGEELGLEPSPGLCRLEEQILLHDPVVAGDRPFIGANPYKGLRAFREPDAGEYFGRDRVVAEVLRTIAAGETLITIVGGSGSGKTSLLRAGVLPAIAKGAVPGADQWLVATMVPGSHPFAELEAALLRASLDPPDSLAAQLEDDETGLLRASLRVLPGEDDRLLLVVDQLEELYTLADPIERARFLTGLVSACSDERGRVVVLTALRADFYPRALEHPEFGDRFDSGVVNIPSLRPDELEEAAVRPAELAGVTIEPPMLGALLADVSGRPGSLPLFQYLLTDLFDRCDGVLTLDAYRGAGGAAGALTRRAEEVYGALQPAEQEAVRQVFLRLVVPDEAGPATRRRLPAGELRSLGLDPAVLGSAIGALVSARLVTTDRDAVTDRPVVDVAHEALLTEWPRLREWIDAARDDLHRHAVLTAALDDWLGADEDPGYLWTGNRLIDYATWADSTDLALTEDEARFVAAGLDHAEADSATIAKQRRQQRRQLWGLVSAVVALLALAAFYLASLLAPGPPQVLLIDAPIGGAISDQLAVGLDDARRRLDVETDELRPEVDAMSQIDEALASEPDVVVVGLDAATYFPTYDWAAATERHPGT